MNTMLFVFVALLMIGYAMIMYAILHEEKVVKWLPKMAYICILAGGYGIILTLLAGLVLLLVG